jgi:RNA polymerase sigma-70 factor (ECF subfamily)
MSDEIEQLVERARGGDEAAFADIYRTYAVPIYRFFAYRVQGRELAEDLSQQVFLKMIEQLPNYRSKGAPFAAWVFRIARNIWIDQHRTSHPAAPLESLSESSQDGPGPEESALRKLDWERVRSALYRLPDEQREVVVCRFFAELSPAETAALMGRSEGSVRVIQHRALAALRRMLLPGEAQR